MFQLSYKKMFLFVTATTMSDFEYISHALLATSDVGPFVVDL